MAGFSHISGAEPSTVTFKAATVTQTRNSSVMHQEIVSIGDPESSLGVVAVLGAAPASTTFAMVVRRVGDSTSIIHGDSTVFQGSSVWQVQVSNGNSSVTITSVAAGAGRLNIGSTAADNAVSISGNSTVSPLAGSTWATRPIQSSAADLQMTATPAAGSTWRTQPGSTLWASSAGFHFDSSGGLQVNGTFAASTGPLTISQLLDSSGGSVTAADSANNAIRVNVVAGAAGGSTIVTVSTGSVRVHQSTAADLQATVGQASTVWAVQLTQYSTIVAVSSLGGAVIIRSSAANALGTVYQSTASELQATVTPVAGSTWATRPIQSSAADMQVTATQSAAVWTMNIGTHIQSSVAPSSNSSGIIVRQVVSGITTAASTSAFASTSFTIASSVASRRAFVTAYSITTTNAGPTKIGFFTSNTLLWPIVLAAVSSAVSGVNLAVTAPAYLFKTTVSEALSLRTKSSTVSGWHVGVSYYQAP